MLDLNALLTNASTYVVAVVLAYVLLMFLIRVSKYYRLKKCPVCAQKLSRQRRTGTEKWINRLSLGILPVRRYRCYSCYWEGQAFEIPKEQVIQAETQED